MIISLKYAKTPLEVVINDVNATELSCYLIRDLSPTQLQNLKKAYENPSNKFLFEKLCDMGYNDILPLLKIFKLSKIEGLPINLPVEPTTKIIKLGRKKVSLIK